MASRLIRRRPLFQRVKAYLNPIDFLLWLSEELDSNDWDQWQKDWATPIGIALNVTFLLARVSCGPSTRRREDDVFGDDIQYSGWLAWLATFITHFLTVLSLTNTAYTFWRKRHYRLFENALDVPPTTPSAHRVRVDSSPLSSSPLRFLSSMVACESAESRSHPDAPRDVWELAVWDPMPLCLKMFCYLSPGHVLVYWLFLPIAPEDPRPSVTVMTTIVLTSLLSVQLIVLRLFFSQQSKDTSVIHKEVLNEYDVKFVHPRTRPTMRDVGTQFSKHDAIGLHRKEDDGSVDTYKPTIIVNKGFHTQPNSNYARFVDPEGLGQRATPSRDFPILAPQYQTPIHQRDSSSPARPNTALRPPQFSGARFGDGGSLGVYSHAHSPLRKAASMNFTEAQRQPEKSTSPMKRESSPVKKAGMRGARWSNVEGMDR